MRQVVVAVVSAALLGGCGGRDDAPPSVLATSKTEWRAVATPADRDRLSGWRTAWIDAVRRARASDAGREIAAEGVLLEPDRFLENPVPPAGDYRCRVLKLGARAGGRAFVTYPAAACRVEKEGDVHSFYQSASGQRPVGLIFPDPGGRAIFLGTLLLEGETRPIDYGRDRARDMAGYVDRIGERRWRLVLPVPAFDAMLEVIEIVPAP